MVIILISVNNNYLGLHFGISMYYFRVIILYLFILCYFFPKIYTDLRILYYMFSYRFEKCRY